jgi:hypothetical protein
MKRMPSGVQARVGIMDLQCKPRRVEWVDFWLV